MIYEYDYESILEDTDDLYDDDQYDMEDVKSDWDNYYHNITQELVDD